MHSLLQSFSPLSYSLIENWYCMCLFLFLDTSRHYLPVNVIKQVIDAMSYAKLVRSVLFKNFSLPFRLFLFFFLAFGPFFDNLFYICWHWKWHSVECSSLAHCRWTIIPVRGTFISKLVERCLLKAGEVHGWGCLWSCWVSCFLSSVLPLQY